MGFWGFAPFQNDYALDEYGGYSTAESLKGRIWQGIKRGQKYSVDVHEISGMILRSFKVYDGICTEANEIEMIKAIATGQFTHETKEAMSGETPMMIMSCATLDFDERKKMLEYALNKMMEIIKNNNTTKVDYKKEPKTLNDLFDSENIVDPIFDNDKIWIQTVTDEESIEYQKIYNLGRETVNCNFDNVKNPMQLLEEQVEWLVEQEKLYRKQLIINTINSKHEQGVASVRLNSEILMFFDIKSKNLAEKNFNRGLMSDSVKELGLLDILKAINVKPVEPKEWFNTYFKSGFYLDKDDKGIMIISVDTGAILTYIDGEIYYTSKKELNAMSKYVKIYKDIKQAESIISKLNNKSEEKQYKGLVVKCINKSYKGNKINAYELIDNKGEKMWVDPDQLKDAIRNEKVTVINLKLTSDNRLINI